MVLAGKADRARVGHVIDYRSSHVQTSTRRRVSCLEICYVQAKLQEEETNANKIKTEMEDIDSQLSKLVCI